ncbi:THUMP-like domain-containing protein [Fulvivirga lutimaris]|uniref:THUMP-like domain-containing protein n=1 Tax=Fulvivirga lutimaris TaxID=1819566 RepID=UPI0012BC8429|nr:class I SAM-dependent methyltransferase [Fulvivirga lutimaris]MTI39218.1 class I SAM-dependent methyltransferase [Fulvivirga lutimaris]
MIEKLLDKDVQNFILENENADPFALSLKNKEFKDIPIKELAAQIAARKVAKTKLPSWYNTYSIIYPPKISMEQCSSELTAIYKSNLVSGQSFIDLTGGAGVDTWAFSKRFDKGSYIEQNENLHSLTENNFGILGVDNLTTQNTTAERFIEGFEGSVDFIYIDPARRDKNQNRVFQFSDCEPNIEELLPKLLNIADKVMIKASPMLDIDLSLKSLSNISAVHIVSVGNDCKEVLYFADTRGSENVEFTTINLTTSNEEVFKFSQSDLTKSIAHYTSPQNYLYEPNASIMKAGAFQLVSEQFNVGKLHQHTHLYTSEKLQENFPGRVFKIETVINYDKKLVAKLIPEGKANIATRNFKDDVAQIRKKTKLKDGGDKYIFACTNLDNKPIMIICTKANKAL